MSIWSDAHSIQELCYNSHKSFVVNSYKVYHCTFFWMAHNKNA